MRSLAVWSLCLALAAGEAALPASTQKLLDESAAAAGKCRQTYEQAVAKEQAKLVAALAKEQERETKKGNLDGALAIKSLITSVQSGLLLKQADASDDLLGDAQPSKAPLAVSSPADLSTDSQLTSSPAKVDNPPAQLHDLLQRAVAIRLPKGDATPVNFTVTGAGTVAVCNGGGSRNADLWTSLLKAGFRRLDEGNNMWFVLNAKPGDRFSVFDPPGTVVAVEVFALHIKSAH